LQTLSSLVDLAKSVYLSPTDYAIMRYDWSIMYFRLHPLCYIVI